MGEFEFRTIEETIDGEVSIYVAKVPVGEITLEEIYYATVLGDSIEDCFMQLAGYAEALGKPKVYIKDGIISREALH